MACSEFSGSRSASTHPPSVFQKRNPQNPKTRTLLIVKSQLVPFMRRCSFKGLIGKKRMQSFRGKELEWIGFLLGIVFVCSFITPGGDAAIHEYKNEAFIRQSNSFFFHGGSEGLFASKTHDFSNKSHKGKSFIKFDGVTFTRTAESTKNQNEMQQNTGLVEAIIVEIKDRERIGGSFLNVNAICCPSTLAKDGSCKTGEVIIHISPDKPEWPRRIKTFFQGKDVITKMLPLDVEINNTGMYYLYFMFCDPQLNGTLINGRTVWKNPDGYLPGKMAPMMTFCGFMSLAYLILGLLWFIRFVQFWKHIIQLHCYITAVIALGMCEMAFWYFEYSNLNSIGSRPMGVTVWAATISTVKKTISRLLLLVVSMGYGVVKPTLGGITSRVLLLGVIYFVASEALELVEHLGNINDFSGKTKLFLVLPLAFLDAWFIVWIFASLSNTLEKLQMRRSMAKLELYRKFTNSLAVSVLLSIAWIGYELYFKATDPLSESWKIAWIIPAFWTLLSYSLLVVICILWDPSHSQTRYAYADEAGEDTEEGVLLTGAGLKTAMDTTAKLERKERSSATDLAFGLGEDVEDKQE